MMKFASIRIVPYDILKVDEQGRHLIRFKTGHHIWFERDEMRFLYRLSPLWTLQPILDGEEKILSQLVKHGVASVKEEPEAFFYITLKVSKGCNLACSYCYEWAHPEKLSLRARTELVKKTIRVFTKYGRLKMVWHGGEPTLFWEDLIEPTLRDTKDKNIVHAMQSNGVRLADEKFAKKVVAAQKEYKIGVGISIDGFEEDNWMRHFADGTPAWEYTVKGIQNIVKYGGKTGTIVVVNNRSVRHMPEIVEWLNELGVKGTRLNPLYPAGHEEIVKITPDREKYVSGLVKVAKKIIEMNLDGDSIKDNMTVTNIIEYLTGFFGTPSSVCVRNVCGAGAYFFSVQYNGDVWPCDHVEYAIGNIFDGWEPTFARPEYLQKFWQIQAMQFQPIFNGSCSACEYKTYCNGGGCTAFVMEMYGEDMYRKPPAYCPKELYRFFEKLIKDEKDLELAALAPNHLYKYWYLGVVS